MKMKEAVTIPQWLVWGRFCIFLMKILLRTMTSSRTWFSQAFMKHLLFAQFIIEKVSGKIIIVHPTFIECILCAWFSADKLRGLSPLTLVIALVLSLHFTNDESEA